LPHDELISEKPVTLADGQLLEPLVEAESVGPDLAMSKSARVLNPW
jgi:hypothetical protein